jgi:hypothetical protein
VRRTIEGGTITTNVFNIKTGYWDWTVELSMGALGLLQVCKQPITPTQNTSLRFSNWDAQNKLLACLVS